VYLTRFKGNFKKQNQKQKTNRQTNKTKTKTFCPNPELSLFFFLIEFSTEEVKVLNVTDLQQ